MKKVFLLIRNSAFFFLIIFCFSACKKSSSPASAGTGDAYMKYKLNGAQKNLDGCSATFVPLTSGVYGVAIAGASPSDLTRVFSITLYSKTAISQGATFTAAIIPGAYLPQGTLAYVEGSKGYGSGNALLSATSIVNVKITELGTDYVKGTFSGTLYDASGGFTTVVYTVSEGEFKAKRY